MCTFFERFCCYFVGKYIRLNNSTFEWDVLDALYFLTPYMDLKQQFESDSETLVALLKHLNLKGYVDAFVWDNDSNDWLRTSNPIWQAPEKMAFLCSKAGLFYHLSL